MEHELKKKNVNNKSQIDAGKTVTFLVSNQSYDIDPVDIKILLDQKMMVQQDFGVAATGQLAQHNWQRFSVTVAAGTHPLFVSSEKGFAQLQKMINVKKDITVTIAFWTNNKKGTGPLHGFFTIETSENMVATM